MITKEEKEFLKESNAIEREYSKEALDDAIDAWEYAKKQFKKDKEQVSIEFILGIHKRLLKRLAPHYAGKIRECAVMIGGEVRSQSKEEIIEELNELCTKWNTKIFLTGSCSLTEAREKQQKEDFVKKWHVGFETTHFACDGNGRTGRILMNIQRLKLGLPLLIIHEGKEQYEYYKWFR